MDGMSNIGIAAIDAGSLTDIVQHLRQREVEITAFLKERSEELSRLIERRLFTEDQVTSAEMDLNKIQRSLSIMTGQEFADVETVKTAGPVECRAPYEPDTRRGTPRATPRKVDVGTKATAKPTSTRAREAGVTSRRK